MKIKAGDKLTVYRVYKTGALSDTAVASQEKYHTEVTVESVTHKSDRPHWESWKSTSVIVSGKFKNIPSLEVVQSPSWNSQKQQKCIKTVLNCVNSKQHVGRFYQLVVVGK